MKSKKTNKRRKNIFYREIILDKLITAGEISAERLLGLALEMIDISKAMMMSPGKAQRTLRKQAPRYVNIDLKSKFAFWSMLSKLKKENLIIKNKKGKITITAKGENYIKLKQKNPSWLKQYINENPFNEEILLVIFDIPERQRNKRDWIRFQLERFGFKILQKSVWWGTAALPKEFVKDLKKYEIIDFVHIFSVKKKGTISPLITTQ